MRILFAVAALAAALAVPALAPSSPDGHAAAPVSKCQSAFRWRVRTLVDARALGVVRQPRGISVPALARMRRPRPLRATTPRTNGPERRVFAVDVRLRLMKAAEPQPLGDGAIELVVADIATNAAMTVVFPDTACSGVSVRAADAAEARSAFLRACGNAPTTHFARIEGRARIEGVGFFGAKPLRRGVAPNGIELAPAVNFRPVSCRRLPEPPVVAVTAGDIACDPDDPAFNAAEGSGKQCRMASTADLIGRIAPNAVLALGDNQYTDGAAWKFDQSYARTWGRFRSITRPVPGNHEYLTRRASGHFAYFGARAGSPARGYYSFELGAWHVVALNSNCGVTGGCRTDSVQLRWLRADLAGNRNRCVLAFWHAPLFSSGAAGGDVRTRIFWETLYAAGADVVLNGHEHDYERLAPQAPDGRLDGRRGIREFVVGTGGRSLLALRDPLLSTEARDNKTFGVLKLTLSPTGYDWQFLPTAGSFTDAGSGTCH